MIDWVIYDNKSSSLLFEEQPSPREVRMFLLQIFINVSFPPVTHSCQKNLNLKRRFIYGFDGFGVYYQEQGYRKHLRLLLCTGIRSITAFNSEEHRG
jgi:hypothetical protein